jgi:hypothetical protein
LVVYNEGYVKGPRFPRHPSIHETKSVPSMMKQKAFHL